MIVHNFREEYPSKRVLDLKTRRSILIFKGKGIETYFLNLRKITIFSVIRCIIEGCLDQAIRDRIHFSQLQSGFVKKISGVRLNASLIDRCLRSFMNKKQNICIVMLELSKEFDRVGHYHIKNTFNYLHCQCSQRT